jgi:hypothetical protein
MAAPAGKDRLHTFHINETPWRQSEIRVGSGGFFVVAVRADRYAGFLPEASGSSPARSADDCQQIDAFTRTYILLTEQ